MNNNNTRKKGRKSNTDENRFTANGKGMALVFHNKQKTADNKKTK